MLSKMSLALARLRIILRLENPMPVLRALAYPEPPVKCPELPQAELWVVDASGLPPRPWRVHPESRFDCTTLGCQGLQVKVCVARQLASEKQRTKDSWRGEGGDFPHCVTEKCAQGRGLREALAPGVKVSWLGAGPGKRFDRGRKGRALQIAAQIRQRRIGLLDRVRVLDLDPDPTGGDQWC